MFFTVEKLSERAIDPVRADGNIFHLISPKRIKIDPCERKVMSFDISFGMPSGFAAQVLPLPELLYKNGISFPASYFFNNQNIEVVLINNSLPDFLFIKNKSALATSHFFGDTNSFFIERGDEVAKLVFTKAEKAELKYD
jgi:dUTPase